MAAEEFKRGLEEWKKEQTRKAMFGLIGSVIKLSFGIFPCGARVRCSSIYCTRQCHAEAGGNLFGQNKIDKQE